jgi:hypothetical protein
MIGCILAGFGAIVGAIVGAVGDITNFLGKRLPTPVDLGPETDFQEPKQSNQLPN